MSAITSGLSAQPQAGLPERGSVLGEAFNNGLRNAGAGLSALGGTALDSVGASGLAKSAYDTSAGLRGAVTTPAVSSYNQVNSVDSALQYATNLVGESVPALAAGLAGAAITKNPLVGATLATAPFTAGDVAVRQQEDPTIAGLGAGRRLAEAVGTGTVNAGLANVVPIALGGKLFGRGVEQAAMSTGRNVLTNVGEAVGGNAAAGALGEKSTQDSLTRLNANRDTSGDEAAIKEAAVGGAAIGAPFAVAGIAGQAAHGKGVKARTDGMDVPGARPGEAAPAGPDGGAPAAPAAPSLLDRAKSMFKPKAEDAPLDEAQRVAKNQDLVDADVLSKAGPDEQAQMLHEADTSRADKVKQWADELFGDKGLSDENKAKLSEAASDLSDRANQATVAGIKVAQDLGARASAAADDFLAAASKKYDEFSSGKKLSDVDSPALQAKIADTISPALANTFPDLVKNDSALKTLASGLRKTMAVMQEKGALDADTVNHVRKLFGDDAPSVMASLHNEVLKGSDKAATARYFDAVNDLVGQGEATKSLEQHVRDSLTPEAAKTATDAQISAAVGHLREFSNGTHTEGMPKSQAEFTNKSINDSLRAHFGDKTDGLLETFRKEGEKNKEASAPEVDPEQGINARDTADLEGQQSREYIGGGKDKAAPELVRSPEAHRAEFSNESQAERLIRQAQVDNPDSVVKFVKVKDMDPEQRAQYKDAGPDDGLIEVGGEKSETRITPDEFQKMRVDTNKTSHAQNNPSRIDTGVKGAVLDARAIVKNMSAKLAYNASDDISAQHRTYRAFMEGIAGIQDHLGVKFDIPGDTVRDANGKERRIPGDVVLDAKGLTFSEARKLSMREPDPAWMKGKTDQEINLELRTRDALKDMNDREVDKAIDKSHDVLAQREQAFQDHVRDVRSNGTKLDKADYAELRKTMGVDNARAAVRAAEAESAARESAVRKAANLDDAGRTDVGADEQIHTAADHKSEKELTRRAGLDDNALRYDNFAKRKPDGSLPDAIIGAIDSKINRLENMTRDGQQPNAIARKVGAKARELYDAIGTMTKMDQALLASIVKDGKVSSISETVNELHQKYMKAPTDDVARARSNISKLAVSLNTTSGDLMLRYGRTLNRNDGDVARATRQLETAMQLKAGALKDLGGLYEKAGAAKKPNAFVERVLGEGDLDSITKQIKSSDDAPGIQRAIESLIDHAGTPRADRVLAAANERMGKLMQDPNTAYSMLKTDPNLTSTSSVHADVRAHIEKVLGKTVDVEFNNMLHAGEFVKDKTRVAKGMAEDVIRVSVHSLDPLGTAHHESLHALFSKLREQGLIDEASPLLRAADSPQVKAQLRELLKGEPGALKQLGNLEERAAYMYQYWAAGKLELAGKPATVLGKIADFFRKTLGLWSNDQRAVHIMEYFNSGEYATQMHDRSQVKAALDKGTNPVINEYKPMIDKLARLGNVIAATGDSRLRDTLIPALHELADKVYAPLHGASTDLGYIPTARIKRGEFINDMATRLGGYDAAHVTDALEAMQRGEKGSTPEQRLVIREVRKSLDSVFDYMKEAGVKVGDLGYGKDYFPRVWDSNTILNNEAGFREMMQHYKDSGDFTGSVDQVIASLTRSDGSELQTETVKPGMQYTKERVLGFVRALDAAPFLEKDMYRTLNGYITQATRRAEWARRFDDTGAGLHALLARAEQEGATKEHLQTASDYLQGVDGTLGDKINPKLRRAFGNMMVYQNIRLLPLALFSSLIDPLGIAVRGGTAGEAWKAFKRGIVEIPKGFKKDAVHDEWTKLAGTMGVIDNAVLMHTLGSSYSQGMVSDAGRKINDTFFKYNLMEQYNVSMRVAATESAVAFLGRHADGTNSKHSERWLAELGLRPNDVIVKNGRPLLTADEYKAAGYSDAKAAAMGDTMTLAVNKWVDGAILRPNAAHKPIWMNDPHFALVAHLKQFVYSFQETILKRVANEYRHGNLGPAYALASYVPFMIAADLVKGMIVGGGSQPDYKEGWDAEDYVWSGLQRAGLFGVGQFGIDAAKSIHRGGIGVGALAGPTVEQFGDAASTVGGSQQFKTFALNALPANQLFDAATEATSTNAAD